LTKEFRAAACRLLKWLGLPLTFRNLYVVELAIAAEVGLASSTIEQAVEEISSQAQAARELGVVVNYFWFEDCGWRFPKLSFKERDDLRMREMARRY
jgi:hypothetical protein